MSVICSQPSGGLPPSFEFRIEETVTLNYPPYDEVVRNLPPYSDGNGSFNDMFLIVVNFGEPFEVFPEGSSYLGLKSTQDGQKKLELKECFPPVLIRWKHYTKAAGTGITTSTDESVLLDKGSPDHTWPAATDYDPGVTDGEWDADFAMHQTV